MEPESGGGGTCRTVQFVSNRCERPGKGPDERCAIRTDGGPRSYFGSPEETQRERRSIARGVGTGAGQAGAGRILLRLADCGRSGGCGGLFRSVQSRRKLL